ncbi:MAG: pectin acetylesterase-family hydrolase [Pseudomonadota bacterium]
MTFTLPLHQVSLGRVVVCALAVALAACSDSDNNNNDGSDDGGVEPAGQFQELVDQGVTRYVGLYSPMATSQEGDVVNHDFAEGDGPLCLDGSRYTMATRDEGSEDLLILLQGGGACWFTFCSATESAGTGIPAAGILDPANPDNPLAGVNTAYLPYCDGGLHASDADVDSDNDGLIDRYHRGLHNLSAGLDVTVRAFPAPSRIVLAGISGGGYGTIFALPLVRQLYPDTPIEVINDSGLGITRPADPDFNNEILEYWNIGAFFPESCPDCVPQGDAVEFLDWQLGQDPGLRLGLMSYAQDFVIGTFFLGIGGPAFEQEMRTTTGELEQRNPDRVRSFIRAGDSHTFLGSDLTLSVEGLSISDWVDGLINDTDDWRSVSD